MNKTIFVDIDGTIFKQKDNLSDIFDEELELLPGVKKAFDNWNWKNYNIIITTGRRESCRESTERKLREAGLFWDHLIMGIDAGGQRIIINDSPTADRVTALAFSIPRDKGFEDDICEL